MKNNYLMSAGFTAFYIAMALLYFLKIGKPIIGGVWTIGALFWAYTTRIQYKRWKTRIGP